MGFVRGDSNGIRVSSSFSSAAGACRADEVAYYHLKSDAWKGPLAITR